MAKIHIDIRDDIATEVALECVKMVIENGRISNKGKQYCYLTSFNVGDDEVMVNTRDYRKSDCFLVWKNKK